MPVFRAFMLERALPAAERGPVERLGWAGWSPPGCWGVVVGVVIGIEKAGSVGRPAGGGFDNLPDSMVAHGNGAKGCLRP